MTLKWDEKFQENITCCLEHQMENFGNFCQSTGQGQICDFDWILLSTVKNA